ncbi:hypothetical protein [Helicobacter macacae]|nr:hypothetical protein [Helicobacter macacae]
MKSTKTFADSGNMVFENDRLILMDGKNSGEVFIATEQGFFGKHFEKT